MVGVVSSTPFAMACSCRSGRLVGRGQQLIAGDEGHHLLGRRVELLPVLLLGQLVDVGPELAGVRRLEERAVARRRRRR